MYKPWDLEVWDIVYVELSDDTGNVYKKWEWKIITLRDTRSFQYPIYIKWTNNNDGINIKYSEVIRVLEWKAVKELLKKPFCFIRCV